MGRREWGVAAADLILGAVCAGCGRPALTLCDECEPYLAAAAFVAWPQPTPAELLSPTSVTPVAAGRYVGPLRSALACFKEEGQFGLLPVLSRMLMASVRFAEFNGPLLVVPVPSSPGAKRRRGYDAIDQLARSSAKLLRKDGVDCRARQVLRHRRPVADQSGLSAVDRWRNLHGALEARERRVLSGRSVLVVDDILTTGATASDAVRALTMVGYRPLGIAVIAATARDPGRPRAE